MKTLLKDLYDCFYTPPEFSEQKREVEECHQALIQVLEKPERRLVLRIMDAQSLMAEKRSIDSFISGFELAWQLSMELNLVLRIMDAQSLMAEKRSIDSFISGFELAWQLSMELNQYEKERSVSRRKAKRLGALSVSGKEEAT